MTNEYWDDQWELAIDRIRTLLSYANDETADMEERLKRAEWAARELEVMSRRAATVANEILFLLENPSYQEKGKAK